MERLLRLMTWIETRLAVVAYGVVILILLGDVIAVEVFEAPIWGTQQIAVLAAILAGMLGLTLATGRGAHFQVRTFERLLPGLWAARLGDMLSAGLFAVFAVAGLQFVQQSLAFSDRAPVLNIPLWPLQLVVPYVFASCALKHVAFALRPALKTGLRA